MEDDESIRSQMKWALAQDYEIFVAGDRMGAMEIVKREKPPITTLDLGLPPHPESASEGFAALSEIFEQDPLAKVIIITGRGEKDNALKAIGMGAYDFFSKPIHVEELKIILNRAVYVSRLERDNRELRQQFHGDQSFEGMLGTSPQTQEVFSLIKKVAVSDVPVLITGESGTGKEMVAKAIHLRSSRQDKPFIVINCGAIPETLLESELFGHEKGAFTGAHIRRQGKVEHAQGGTLFLDEIGELSLSLQVKLLRFLQEKKIERIGGREEIYVDARVLTATNKDLKQALKVGRFREDLFYRLGVVTISLPPLRDRQGDILFLANAFLQRYSLENRKNIRGFTEQATKALEKHRWEGNIRELENRIKRAVVMSEGGLVAPEDLELSTRQRGYQGKSLREAKEAIERDFVERALEKYKGKITKIAEELGVSRPKLYEMLDKYKIERD